MTKVYIAEKHDDGVWRVVDTIEGTVRFPPSPRVCIDLPTSMYEDVTNTKRAKKLKADG